MEYYSRIQSFDISTNHAPKFTLESDVESFHSWFLASKAHYFCFLNKTKASQILEWASLLIRNLSIIFTFYSILFVLCINLHVANSKLFPFCFRCLVPSMNFQVTYFWQWLRPVHSSLTYRPPKSMWMKVFQSTMPLKWSYQMACVSQVSVWIENYQCWLSAFKGCDVLN